MALGDLLVILETQCEAGPNDITSCQPRRPHALSTRLMSVLFWPCGQYRTFHATVILTVYPSQCHKIPDECYKYLIYSELFCLLTIVKNYKSIKSLNMFIISIGMSNFIISRWALAFIKIHNCLYLVDLICHNSCVSLLNYHHSSLKNKEKSQI